MTFPFRDKTPVRQANRKTCSHYNSYRKTLKENFNSRCGYCGTFDKIRRRGFTIDHFIPQKPDGWTHDLKANDYYNLVYSCSYCNAAKTNKWPTKDVRKPNDGKIGFIDPTDSAYDDLFVRNEEGEIIVADCKNLLAAYIYKELNLKRMSHSILWKLERIDKTLQEINKKVSASHDTTLDSLISELLKSYYELSTDFHHDEG